MAQHLQKHTSSLVPVVVQVGTLVCSHRELGIGNDEVEEHVRLYSPGCRIQGYIAEDSITEKDRGDWSG